MGGWERGGQGGEGGWETIDGLKQIFNTNAVLCDQ